MGKGTVKGGTGCDGGFLTVSVVVHLSLNVRIRFPNGPNKCSMLHPDEHDIKQ